MEIRGNYHSTMHSDIALLRAKYISLPYGRENTLKVEDVEELHVYFTLAIMTTWRSICSRKAFNQTT
jgi:hypothetical protein